MNDQYWQREDYRLLDRPSDARVGLGRQITNLFYPKIIAFSKLINSDRWEAVVLPRPVESEVMYSRQYSVAENIEYLFVYRGKDADNLHCVRRFNDIRVFAR